VILPGSKSTISDLENFRANGWDIDLQAHHRRGGQIIGICGGYQMLGRKVHDPDGIEGAPRSIDGLGYLNIETTMIPKKNLSLTKARSVQTNTPVSGYEIHLGQSSGADCQNPWLQLADRYEGAVSANGLVRGCYLHGLFASDGFRAEVLEMLGTHSQLVSYDATVEDTLDQLAAFIELHLDVDALIALARPVAL
jgi:adenosylcobyric acid synthase